MPILTIDWSAPTRETGEPVHRDRTALWVFGVVIDAATVDARRFVVPARGQRAGSIEVPIAPIDGLATAGVIALLCDWTGCGDQGNAAVYRDVAADALDRLVAQRLPAARPVANARDLELWIEQDIADTVRRGWTGLGPLADRHLATAHRLLTLDGPATEALDLRLPTRSGDRRVLGTLRYDLAPAAAIDVRVACDADRAFEGAGSGRS